jgi:ribosome maturation factor RimP
LGLKALLDKLRALAPQALTELGLELVSVETALENGRRIVRVVIDKAMDNIKGTGFEGARLNEPGLGESGLQESGLGESGKSGSKVTIDECVAAARKFSAWLDETDDPNSGPAYVLEVSSPGLNRRLYTEADFRRFSGSRAKVKLLVEGRPVTYKGRLATAVGPLRLITPEGEITFELGPDLKASLIPEI